MRVESSWKEEVGEEIRQLTNVEGACTMLSVLGMNTASVPFALYYTQYYTQPDRSTQFKGGSFDELWVGSGGAPMVAAIIARWDIKRSDLIW